MIDIHAHFLPHIDDGARTTAESLEMLSLSYSQGVQVCVATPHCVVHRDTDIAAFLKKRESSYARLMKEAAGAENMPHIYMGAEVLMDNDISNYSGIEKLCIKQTNAMLVEMLPQGGYTARYADWLYSLNLKGIKPIIAHLDRYPFWESLLKESETLCVDYQINAARFLTMHGRHLLKKIFKYNKKYIVSSDMHNMTSRKCCMESAYKRALKMYGRIADNWFLHNAQTILEK